MIFWNSFDWILKIYLKIVSSSYYAKVCSLEREKNYNSTRTRLHETLIPKQSLCCRQCCWLLLRHSRSRGSLTNTARVSPLQCWPSFKSINWTLPTVHPPHISNEESDSSFLLDVAVGNCSGTSLLYLSSLDLHCDAAWHVGWMTSS